MSERQYQLELRRIQLEEWRMKTEEDRMKNDRDRNARTDHTQKWVVAGAMGSIAAFLAIFAFWAWDTHRINRAMYEMKFLEVALQGTNAAGAYNRVKLAGDLFRRSVPGNLEQIRQRVERDYYGTIERVSPETLTTRAEIMQLLVEHPEMREQILQDCDALYPREKWASQMRDFNSR